MQVWVGVLPRGPKGCALNSSYQSRESREYREDLGYALVNIARLVPDGLLVFFPSYTVLTSCIEFWKQPVPGQSGHSLTPPSPPSFPHAFSNVFIALLFSSGEPSSSDRASACES